MANKKDDKKEDKKEEGNVPEGAEGAEAVELTPEQLEERAKKKKKKKKLLIIIGIVVFLVVEAVVILKVLQPDEKVAEAKIKNQKEAALQEEIKKPVYYDLPDITVNLNSPTPRPHFINLKLTLELDSKKSVKVIEAQLPRVIDSFNIYLREIRKEDLQSSAGTYRLENELVHRLDKIFGEGKVKDILFREMIIQ